MPVSRLRLRLTGLFALIFAIALLVLGLSLVLYLRRRASETLTAELVSSSEELSRAIVRETGEGHKALERAVSEALKEWPQSASSFVVRDTLGHPLASTGQLDELEHIPDVRPPSDGARILTVPMSGDGELRVVAVPLTIAGRRLTIVGAASTADLREREDTLNGWIALAVPLVLLLSLTAGYALSRLALGPVLALGDAAARINATNPSTRLPVRKPADEVDRVAGQFNGVLDRLQAAQVQNQHFLRQVAHQIRTPLTLVLGESELALDRERSAPELREALQRIQRAGVQIRRRVSDLFLLAQAEAGESPALRERVELDQVVLEVVDLFRARAHALGQTLELGSIDEAVVRGDRHLLQEAVAELIENACRHGNRAVPVRIALVRSGSGARLEVENAGEPVQSDVPASDSSPENPRGLGLFILSWIATVHNGAISIARVSDRNQVALVLPLAPEDPSVPVASAQPAHSSP